MIANLFSIFDPSSRIFSISLNWIRSFLGIFFMANIYWLIPSRNQIIFIKIINTLHNEFNIIIQNKFKGITFIFIRLLLFIFFNNFMGLFPYIFTASRHMVYTLSISLPLWITFILYGWIVNINHIFIHLVPQNTPVLLISFIVIIETIRNVIRPITLAIRLIANIITGHLLITLIRSSAQSIRMFIAIIIVITQIVLVFLELIVSIIQRYVFVTLRTLYSSEVN